MQTITCQIKLNDYHIGNRAGVTPTEYQLLEAIHKKEAGGKCVLNPVFSADAEEIERNKAGEIVKRRPRTNAEEIRRLKGLYHVKARSGAPGTHLLDDLYPGLNPELPQTFAEVGLTPAEKPAETIPEAHPESEATTDGEKVLTPVAHPPLSAPLLHANELLQELESLEAIPDGDRTTAQSKRIKQLSILKPEPVAA
jgi:hypothetical protein